MDPFSKPEDERVRQAAAEAARQLATSVGPVTPSNARPGSQRGMAECNDSVGEDGRIEMRIGIDLGDLMVEEADPERAAPRLRVSLSFASLKTAGKTLAN